MKQFLAEFLGTFALVLFGCGAAVIAGKMGPDFPAGLGLLGISFAFGLSVVVMAYAIGGISGCHINPAITVAMMVAGKLSGKSALVYIIAQLAGALVAASVLLLIRKGAPDFAMQEWALGANGWGPGYLGGYNTTSAFVMETVNTFLFLFVIFMVTGKWGNSTMAGLAIGFTLVLIHLVSIPVTGTSVNPARSFGPALLAGGKALQQLWLFIVAPLLGAVLAALAWRGLFQPRSEDAAAA